MYLRSGDFLECWTNMAFEPEGQKTLTTIFKESSSVKRGMYNVSRSASQRQRLSGLVHMGSQAMIFFAAIYHSRCYTILGGENIQLHIASSWVDDIATIFPILTRYCSLLDESTSI